MPGVSFLNKKDFHTGSFKNIEKVWLAEQRKLEQDREIAEHHKRLQEEKYEEELKRHKVQAGLMGESELNKMDWMYNHANIYKDREKNITEEYLLGKPLEEGEKPVRQHVFKESRVNDKNEEFLKNYEDPLLDIKRKEMQPGKKIAERAEQDLSFYLNLKNSNRGVKEQVLSTKSYKELERKYKKELNKKSNNKTNQLFNKYLKEKMGPLTTFDKEKGQLKFNALKKKKIKKLSMFKKKDTDDLNKMKQNHRDVKNATDNFYAYTNKKEKSYPSFLNKEVKRQYNRS